MPRPPPSHKQGLSPRVQTHPASIRREAFFKAFRPPQHPSCFSCSLFSPRSHSQRPSSIPSKPFPLPLNRQKHQSAKNTEITNRNFSPEDKFAAICIFKQELQLLSPDRFPAPTISSSAQDPLFPSTTAEEGAFPIFTLETGVKARAGGRKRPG